jgi:hypothetical protein
VISNWQGANNNQKKPYKNDISRNNKKAEPHTESKNIYKAKQKKQAVCDDPNQKLSDARIMYVYE